MGGANGLRCLVQFVGVAVSAMSTMSWLAMYIEQGTVLRTLAKRPRAICLMGRCHAVGAPTARTLHDIYFGRHDARSRFA